MFIPMNDSDHANKDWAKKSPPTTQDSDSIEVRDLSDAFKVAQTKEFGGKLVSRTSAASIHQQRTTNKPGDGRVSISFHEDRFALKIPPDPGISDQTPLFDDQNQSQEQIQDQQLDETSRYKLEECTSASQFKIKTPMSWIFS
jgi:hypothetical protein